MHSNAELRNQLQRMERTQAWLNQPQQVYYMNPVLRQTNVAYVVRRQHEIEHELTRRGPSVQEVMDIITLLVAYFKNADIAEKEGREFTHEVKMIRYEYRELDILGINPYTYLYTNANYYFSMEGKWISVQQWRDEQDVRYINNLRIGLYYVPPE